MCRSRILVYYRTHDKRMNEGATSVRRSLHTFVRRRPGREAGGRGEARDAAIPAAPHRFPSPTLSTCLHDTPNKISGSTVWTLPAAQGAAAIFNRPASSRAWKNRAERSAFTRSRVAPHAIQAVIVIDMWYASLTHLSHAGCYACCAITVHTAS